MIAADVQVKDGQVKDPLVPNAYHLMGSDMLGSQPHRCRNR